MPTVGGVPLSLCVADAVMRMFGRLVARQDGCEQDALHSRWRTIPCAFATRRVALCASERSANVGSAVMRTPAGRDETIPGLRSGRARLGSSVLRPTPNQRWGDAVPVPPADTGGVPRRRGPNQQRHRCGEAEDDRAAAGLVHRCEPTADAADPRRQRFQGADGTQPW